MNGSDFNNDDIKKIRKQDLTGKAAEEIMKLIEELKEKLGE